MKSRSERDGRRKVRFSEKPPRKGRLKRKFEDEDEDEAEEVPVLDKYVEETEPDVEEEQDEDSDDDDSAPESNDEEVEELRLTSRQRAMRNGNRRQGGQDQPSPPPAEPTMDREEMEDRIMVDEGKELKRQQQARLRRISHEKRKEEKRAATIEKVLRGVTGKRKRQSQEAVQAAVEREQKHLAKRNSVRFLSTKDDDFVAFPEGSELPSVLQQQKKPYPPKLERDPRTGKLIRQAV